ncbi:MAG: putative amidoligase enzyme [Prokaryotic dsDNA virus sp.]|nr:MAG: putative amidoligase enzyme [Prokaryotic dsDNA virus sp.]|tara:strand:+ start:34332 stop:35402 length:1071 start_codon:yes stop_codon:yes gene_type:complete
MSRVPIPSDFFKRSAEKDEPSYNIGAMMGHRTTKGDVGLEIEVEGNKFPKGSPYGTEKDEKLIPKQWKYTPDGSLRGQDNAEYILARPIKFSEVDKALDDLWKMFKDYGSKLDDSNRTSVHVHLNAQGWHLNRLTSFLALYFSVEELLTEWCGEHRVGNLFCLRSKDATNIVAQIRDFIASDGKDLPSQGMHYAGLNCHSLTKFGSIEVRSLRGATDPETIKTWVSILQRIYEISGDYTDPRLVVEGFSGAGPLDYLNTVLGPHTNTIVQGSGFDHQQVMASVYEGIRLAQDLCYCRDWSKFNPEKVKMDPFGRRIKKKTTLNEQPTNFNEYMQYLEEAQQAIATPVPQHEGDDIW